MKSAADVWVCRVCRSINPIRSGRCYRCSTPIEVAAAKPEDLTMAPTESEVKAVLAPTGIFRSSETRAVIVTIAAVAFILGTLLALWITWSVNDLRADGEAIAASDLFRQRLPLVVLAPVLGIVALLAYAAWIRRVIENLLPLGLGYSRVSPTWAFFEPLIPGLNIYSLPARMVEVVQKLGGQDTVLALLVVAVGVAIVPGIVLVYLLRFTRLFGTGADYLRASGPALFAVFAFQAVGLLLGLIVIWRIEGMIRTKLAGMPAATAR